jgi:hypothetical protein
LRENGWDADAIKTEFEGESETEGEELPSGDANGA